MSETAPTWATDTANVIRALTPAADTVRTFVRRRNVPAGTRPAPQQTRPPARAGNTTNTLLIGGAIAVVLYMILKKR